MAAGGDRGWWRALIPALAIVAVLFAALDVRAASQEASSATTAASAGQELAAAVDQLAPLERAALTRADRSGTQDLTRARRQVIAAAALTERRHGDEAAASTALHNQADAAVKALQDAKRGRPTSASARRASSLLAALVPAARSYSDALAAAGTRADDRAGHRLTLTMIGVLVLITLLLGTFWSRRSAADAERRERHFRALLRNSSDLVVVIDPDTFVIRSTTSAIERILACDSETVTGTALPDLAHPDDRAALIESLKQADGGEGGQPTGRWRAAHRDGGWVDVEASWLDLRDDPSVRGLVVTVRDVGERTDLEDQLRHQAFHDPLTALPNRSLFENRVRHAVASARRHGRAIGVLFVDLDDFKTVNDSLGHAAGDELLRQVAGRLDLLMRGSDTVARLGGDEFAVLVEEAVAAAQAETIAGRIHAGMERPFEIEGHELFMHASVGIAQSESGSTSEDLMRNADTAMYAAKAAGKGRSETFHPTMHMEVRRRLQLSGDLRRALLNDDIFAQYQPLVDLESGRVVGAEALARWCHPTLGEIPPGDFIPVAEETGLIVPLGGRILHQACRQARIWQDTTPGDSVYVSVNVSPRQFRQPGAVVEQVREATEASGIEPSLLVLEITESVLMQDRAAVRHELSELQKLGVRVAIDDFGTGYSALSYLRDFPIDMVKMDQSFVSDLSAGKGDQALVRSVVELGEALGMQIVAEGIEHRDQRDHLSDMRCDIGQGYYFARPLDADRMMELVTSSHQMPASADRAAATSGDSPPDA